MRRPFAALLVLLAVPLLDACGGDDGDAASTDSEFCDATRALDERIVELDAAFEEGDRPPVEILGDMEAELERLAREAPAGQAGDLADMASSVRRLADAISAIDLEEPGALEAVAEDLAAIDAELDASSDRVAAALERECGVDIADAEE